MSTADLYCEKCGTPDYNRCTYRYDRVTGELKWLCPNCGTAEKAIVEVQS